MTIDGAADAEIFQVYLCEILVPTLLANDIVLLDNFGAHMNEATLALLAAAGTEARFLPAYSPDLNPIETDMEQGEGSLAAAGARTHSALLQEIAQLLGAVRADDASHLFCPVRL